MNLKGLILLNIGSDSHTTLKAKKPLFSLKSSHYSTCILLCKPNNKLFNKVMTLISLLFLILPLYLNAQSGLGTRITTRVNNPAVTVNVDNLSAQSGAIVTFTLQGVSDGKTVVVKVINTTSNEEVSVSLNANTYTFTMPAEPVYIDVNVQSSTTAPAFYPLTVETAGVAAGKVSVDVKVNDVTINAPSGYQAEADQKVTVTLQTPLAPKLTLTKTEAFAPDGSWRWTGLSGNAAVTTLTFTMPATAVTVRFTIYEDTTIDPPVGPVDPVDPPVNPPVEPDDPIDPDPDEPDIPVEPDDPATAVDPIALPDLHIRTSAGTLRLIADYPGQATIYTFSGQRVAALRLETGVERQQALPRGVYILRSGNRSIKFTL